MSMTEIVKMFGERKIRSVWDDETETWYFLVIDVGAKCLTPCASFGRKVMVSGGAAERWYNLK